MELKLRKIVLLIFVTMVVTLGLIAKESNATTEGNYTYTQKEDGTIEISKYNNALAKDLIIASTINGKTVTSIANEAFKDCTNLTGNITIPTTIKDIGNKTFSGCTGLTSDIGTLLANIVGKNGIKKIPAGIFENCSGLTGELVIPTNVTEIGSDAFSGCSKITGDISNILSKLVNQNKIKNIPSGLFYYCNSLTGKLTIPSGTENIGNYAFFNCSGIKGELTIPKTITQIGWATFSGCTGLTGTLNIPSSITQIGASAFDKCSGFTGILTIPDSVTKIEKYAFSGCSGLSGDLIIPQSVISIEGEAFSGATKIQKIIFYSTAPTMSSDALKGINATIHYKKATSGFEQAAFTGKSMSIYDVGFVSINEIEHTFKNKTPVQFTARIVPPELSQGVNWKTSDDKITTVSNNGLVTPIANGTATITVTSSDGTNITDNCIIEVILTTEISLTESTYKFTAPGTHQLTATTTPLNASKISWSSSNEKVATVSETGLIKAIGAGTCNIKASSTDGTNIIKACAVTVEIKATTLSFKENSHTFKSTNSYKLEPIFTPTEATNTLTWSTSNSSVADVSSAGIITPKGNGNCNITATTTDGTNLTATANIKVLLATSVNFVNQHVAIRSKEPIQLAATIEPVEAEQNVTWKSSDTKIANVSNTGIVTPVTNGNCTITATSTDGTKTTGICHVSVDIKVNNITLSEKEYKFSNKNPHKLIATVLPTEATNKDITWESNNTEIATVDENGNVTPIKNGTCIITAKTLDGTNLTDKCNITVTLAETITLSQTRYTFTTKDYMQLIASIKPTEAIQTVTWTTSDDTIATVNSEGKVIPINNGSCYITAMAADGTGKTAKCEIRVEIPVEIKGDVNKDGVVDTKDINYMLRVLSGDVTLTQEQYAELLKKGDVNSDGYIDTKDVNKIIKYTVRKITDL